MLEGERPETVVVGSHVDSVPNGGWLDGALGVMAALEVLREAAASGTPPVTVALVDWADEEGARFGRSLFGSSAVAGTLDPDAVRDLRRRRRASASRTWCASTASSSTARTRPARGCEHVRAYLELHIEQGPVLESEGLAVGTVLGTVGVERHRASSTGRPPTRARRRSTSAATRSWPRRASRSSCARSRAVTAASARSATRAASRASSPPCRAGRRCCVDQRHLDAGALAAMLAEMRKARRGAPPRPRAARSTWEHLWRIDPIPFDAS